MKNKKPNKNLLLFIVLAGIIAVGVFYAAPNLPLKLPMVEDEQAEIPSLGEKIPEDAVTPSPEPQDGERIVDASTNLYLDIRREKTEEEEKENPLADRQVYFWGIGDETLPYDAEIHLENLPENEDFMMKYVVTNLDTGDTVFETGLIPSGENVPWALGHSLGEGEHHLNFHIVPYYPQDDQYIPMTSANNDVTLTVIGNE